MKNRSIVAVILLPFVTLGIYAIYWLVSTKGELNKIGAQIPTAWLLIIPLVNIWWMWKYFEGAETVTNSKVSGVLMFVLDLFITLLVPMAICQDAYNNLDSSPDIMASNDTPDSLETSNTPETSSTPPDPAAPSA